jgi:hypothetical protein
MTSQNAGQFGVRGWLAGQWDGQPRVRIVKNGQSGTENASLQKRFGFSSTSGLEQAWRPRASAGRSWRHGRAEQPRAAAPNRPERSRVFSRDTLGLGIYREFGSGPDRGTVFFLGGGFLELSGRAVASPAPGVALWCRCVSWPGCDGSSGSVACGSCGSPSGSCGAAGDVDRRP